jgi:DNA-binding NarL/FixJ family response regulator
VRSLSVAAEGSNGSVEHLTATVGLVAADVEARHRIASALRAGGLDVALEARDAAGLIDRPKSAHLSAVVVAPREGSAASVEIRALRQRLRSVPVVAMISSTDEGQCRRAISAGADGAVLDRDLDEALATTVAAAAAGQVSFPQALQGTPEPPALTPREKQVLDRVVTGSTNALIARELGLAESTIKSHLSSAFAKLGVASRAEAAALILDPARSPNLDVPAEPDASE